VQQTAGAVIGAVVAAPTGAVGGAWIPPAWTSAGLSDGAVAGVGAEEGGTDTVADGFDIAQQFGQLGLAQFLAGVDPLQGVHAGEQHVHRVGRELHELVLGGDETIFENMCHLHGLVHADDFGCPLDRMGGPHHRFQVLGVGWLFFQRQ
jgi:hypothetical protein